MNTKLSLMFVLVLFVTACAAPGSPANPVVADAASTATAMISAAQTKVGTTPMPETQMAPAVEGDKNESWEIQYFEGATSAMKDWNFMTLAPADWPNFPNVDNGQYPASQGVEYGEDLSAFCQQNQTCDFNVAARHYRLYTGDYSLEGVGECREEESGQGCLLLAVNVGEVTAIFRDQTFDYGFTVTGRYWDGNYLPQAMWAVMSHASANMLNMATSLNPGGTNAGANCSVPGGCTTVEATFMVTSGNKILLIGQSTVSR